MKSIIKIITLSILTVPLFGQQINEWLILGHNSYKSGDINGALTNYDYYIENQPDDPRGYLYRARLHEAMGNTHLSQIDLNIAQKLNPLSLMYINSTLRSVHLAKKTYDYNFEDLDQTFIKTPAKIAAYKSVLDQIDIGHSQDSLIEIVLKQLSNLEIKEAKATLDKVKINNMNQSVVLDLKGKILMKQGDYIKAKGMFLEAIDINPDFAIAYHNLSICYNLLDQPKLAKETLKKAISLRDDVSLFYFTLAKLNETNRNNDDAIKNYKKAISLDDEYKEAMVNYSQLLKSLGDYEEGLTYLDKALDMVDEDERKYLAANVHFVYGEYEESLDLYESYLMSNPEDVDAMYNIGLNKILLRQYDEGCLDIEESLILFKNDKRQNLYNMFCENSLFSKN